jgi:hypothetical protein
MTPLHVACGPVVKITPRQFEICRLLIAAKADVNRTGFKYDTSRHTKAKHPHLFERCNDHLVFSASTPLHEASYYNKVDICRMLIACKANAAARNMCGHCWRAAHAVAAPISLTLAGVTTHPSLTPSACGVVTSPGEMPTLLRICEASELHKTQNEKKKKGKNPQNETIYSFNISPYFWVSRHMVGPHVSNAPLLHATTPWEPS